MTLGHIYTRACVCHTNFPIYCGDVISSCCSYVLYLILCIFLQLAGAALAYISSYVIISYKNFSSFTVDKYAIIPVAIILAVAIVMFIVGIIGCCATLRESNIGLGIVSMVLSRNISDRMKIRNTEL